MAGNATTLPPDGVYEHIPAPVYHSWPAWSASMLKPGLASMLHLRYRLDTPMEPTAAMVMGTNAHLRVLEGADVTDRFVMWEGGRRFGAAWDEFCDENADAVIVKPDEYRALQQMRERVLTTQACAAVLTGTKRELSLLWTDPDTGARCKARVDYYKRGVWGDYKTTASIDQHAFGATAGRLGYHLQLGHYADGIGILMGERPPCRLIVQDQKAPWDCCAVDVDEKTLRDGVQERSRVLIQALECERTGMWPGRYPEGTTLRIPDYVMGEDETDLDWSAE